MADKPIKDYIVHGLKIGDKVKRNLEKGTPRADEKILEDADDLQRRAHLAAPALMNLFDAKNDAEKAQKKAEKDARRFENKADKLSDRVTRLTGQAATAKGQNAVYKTENSRLITENGRVVTENGNLRTDVGRLTGENTVYSNENRRLLTENGTLITENGNLRGDAGRLTGERDAVQSENSRNRTWIFYSTIAAGVLALTSGLFGGAYLAKGNSASDPAPVVRPVETKPAVVESKELYTIETLADSQHLKISKESLGKTEDVYFAIEPGAKDALVNYINKAEAHAAKNGKLGTRVRFLVPELVESLKELYSADGLKVLYSKDGKTIYYAEGKLVKEDITARIEEMGE